MFGSKKVSVVESDEFRKVIEDALVAALGRSSKDVKETLRVGESIDALKKKVADLEIQQSKKEEEFARREREVEHMVGLERKRQEFELASGKREATLSVREENLAADRKRFEEQMAFHEKRFTEEVSYLKQIIGDIAERLPTANFTGNLSARKGK